MNQDNAALNSDISLDKIDDLAHKRPLLVNPDLVSEMQAESLLQPLDQVYSPSVHLHGILYVYRYILNATRSFHANLRTHLPAASEMEASLKSENYKIGDLNKILAYLTNVSPPNPPFCIEYCAAFLTDERLSLMPVYLCGNENVEKIIDKSDELGARNIVEKASVSQPWADRIGHGEFLTQKIRENKIHETYFLGYFKFDEEDKSQKCRDIYERRILPLLRGRSEILYFEIPRGLQSDLKAGDSVDEPVVLINDNRDLKFRYQFFSAQLISAAKKIIPDETAVKSEALHLVRKAFEDIKKVKSPDSLKNLAGALLQTQIKSNTIRQMALEIFLMRDKAVDILRVEKEALEAQNKLYLDLLIKRVQTRKWLIFIPASFYPTEVFDQAISSGKIIGVRKSGADLGMTEDYYALIETSLLSSLLRIGNWFELSIIEDILNANSLSSKDYYKKSLYKRKKSIVFLIINPFVYLFRILFTRKRSFIENTFRKEVAYRGKNFLKGMQVCLETSGINFNIKKEFSEDDSQAAKSKSEPTEKQLLTKRLLEIMFPDPAPAALFINEIEYREKLFKVAREIRSDAQFPQYADKSEEAIIADIQPFLKDELVENIYEGTLPTGLDARGKKFTRKLYFPKQIKDQRLVYDSIREELEHGSNAYGSKDSVEYYRAMAKVFSESSMDKIRSSEKLKTEAAKKTEEKSEKIKPSGAGHSADFNDSISGLKETPEKPASKSKGFFGFAKSPKKKAVLPEKKESNVSPEKAKQMLNARQKIERTAKTLASEMKEKYITSKKLTGSNLFPISPPLMEELLDIDSGTLSVFSSENTKAFTEHFLVIKAGKQYYYFPKSFFNSNKNKIEKFYTDLIEHEASMALPNGEILHKAQDILGALKLKR